MRYFSVVTVFIVSILSTGCQKKKTTKTDLDRFELKGKVKTVKQEMYLTVEKFGELFKDRLHHENSMAFNQEGNLSEYVYYNDGKISSKDVYSYNTAKHLAEYVTYNDNGELESKHRTIYQDAKNTIQESFKADGSIDRRWINKYDDQENEIEERFYMADPEFKLHSTESNRYKYNSKNQIIEIVSSGTDYTQTPPFTGSTVQRLKYDEAGNKVESKFDNEEYPSLFKYDVNGNEIESIAKRGGTDYITKTENKLDDHKNWVYKVIRYPTNAYIYERVISYY